MPVDVTAMCRSFLPNNPRMAEIILAVCKETYKVRCLPRDLVRTLVNRGMQEIRRSGHEFMREPEFYQNMMEHARSLNSRYRGEIARLNNTGIKQAF